MIDEKKIYKNHEIRTPRVRVINDSGEQVGVMSTYEALQIAKAADLDLVEVAPTANPPVCRIMDYNKFMYDQQKRQHAERRKQKQIEIKEIKFRPTTDEGDYQVKLRSIIRFLEEGNKAKITLKFKGREIIHPELGQEMMKRIQDDLAEISVVDVACKMEGKQLMLILAPKKKN